MLGQPCPLVATRTDIAASDDLVGALGFPDKPSVGRGSSEARRLQLRGRDLQAQRRYLLPRKYSHGRRRERLPPIGEERARSYGEEVDVTMCLFCKRAISSGNTCTAFRAGYRTIFLTWSSTTTTPTLATGNSSSPTRTLPPTSSSRVLQKPNLKCGRRSTGSFSNAPQRASPVSNVLGIPLVPVGVFEGSRKHAKLLKRGLPSSR